METKHHVDLVLYALIAIFVVLLVLLITNNINLIDLSNPNKNTEIVIVSGKDVNVDKSVDNSEFYGATVDTQYGNRNQRYPNYTFYGDFKYSSTTPNITFAGSNDGNHWTVAGSSEHATFTNTHFNNDGNALRTSFIMRMSNLDFRYITVYVQGEAEDLNCRVKMFTT